jgi:hypothetical protein
MPFTLAHPAAILPLVRLLGRRVVPSALVVGSMTPDLAYVVPYVRRAASHSPAGLVWFCLPVGLLAYWAFHRLIAPALVALLPTALRARLTGMLSRPARAPAAPLAMVLACLLLGAMTHVAWDAFTHRGAAGVVLIPALDTPLFAFGGHEVRIYRLLQHASTAVGLLILAAWLRPRLLALPAVEVDPMPRGSRLLLLGVLAAAIAVGAAHAIAAPARLIDPADIDPFLRAAGRVVIGAFRGTVVGLLLLGALWRVLDRPAVAVRR